MPADEVQQLPDYPTLQTVMDLARVHLNDWQAGLTSTPGEGQITTDNLTASPQTLPSLMSAIRSCFRKLRNAGAATLIKDNVQVLLPAINPLVNPPNTQVQTNLNYKGFFDGYNQVNSGTICLPQDFMFPLDVSEQQPISSNLPFQPMQRAQHGLMSQVQGFFNGQYEWRGDALWFPGTLTPILTKLRYKTATVVINPTDDFASTTIPIFDCEEYVAWQVAYLVTDALEGETPTNMSSVNCKKEADEAMLDLKTAYVLQAQTTNYRRPTYGNEDNFSGTGWVG